jgi:peptidoglycan/xylan/chitin deacetylase (PgdA/CDA1 family)
MTSIRTGTPIPILGYHSVGDLPRDGTMRWSVSPGDFEEQMAVIAERGLQALTVARYAAALRGEAALPQKPVLVTFDDGFADLATTALPVLQRYRLVATAFLVSAWVGARSPHADPVLDWEQVHELRAHGIQIGSHGHSHRALDCLPAADAEREARLSRQVLAEGLGEEVVSFAYPYGYHSSRVRGAVHAAGYSSACGVKNALSHQGDDLFALARVLVTRDMGAARIGRLLDGEGAPLSWPGERLLTRGWRAYRRGRYLVDGPLRRLRVAASAATAGQGRKD